MAPFVEHRYNVDHAAVGKGRDRDDMHHHLANRVHWNWSVARSDLDETIGLKGSDAFREMRGVIEKATQLFDVGLIFCRARSRSETIAVASDDAVRRDKASGDANDDHVPARRDRHGVNLQVANARLHPAERDLLKPPLLSIAIAREGC